MDKRLPLFIFILTFAFLPKQICEPLANGKTLCQEIPFMVFVLHSSTVLSTFLGQFSSLNSYLQIAFDTIVTMIVTIATLAIYDATAQELITGKTRSKKFARLFVLLVIWVGARTLIGYPYKLKSIESIKTKSDFIFVPLILENK